MEQEAVTTIEVEAHLSCAPSIFDSFAGIGTIEHQPHFVPVTRRALMAAVNTTSRALGLRPSSVVVLDAEAETEGGFAEDPSAVVLAVRAETEGVTGVASSACVVDKHTLFSATKMYGVLPQFLIIVIPYRFYRKTTTICF